jgi:hypothetical protein
MRRAAAFILTASLLCITACLDIVQFDASKIPDTSGDGGEGSSSRAEGGTTSASSSSSSGSSSAGSTGSSGGSSGATTSSSSSASSSSSSTSSSSSSGGTSSGGDAGKLGSFSLTYECTFCDNTGSLYIGAQITVTNGTGADVLLSDIIVRYYYTNDAATGLTEFNPNFADISTPGMNDVTITPTYGNGPVSPPLSDADTAAIFRFAGANTLPAGSSLVFNWNLHGGPWTQSNDYSFNASASSAPVANDHIVVDVSGCPAWGIAP